ncbi:MAG: AraC family transcriptional regulator [bacterium]|nr:AraC family transcriptional regulator [bacterium]
MDWIARLNSAMNYIEENLTGDIDLEKLSKLTLCSTYHFQRMFTYMAEIPLSEYIRRRKMSRAAADLQKQGSKVIDIALKYGYQSPTAFNRAFQRIHGISPSEARSNIHKIKAYPPISFQISIKGERAMEYRIENKEAFRIVGISMPLNNDLEQNFEVVPAMWQKAVMDGTIEKLTSRMDGELQGLLGVSSCNKDTEWRYYIAVASNQPIDEQLEEFLVPKATWAIFTGKGTNISIQELEKRIVTEWLPTSGYEYANAPDMEVYISPNPEDALYEVWIPVIAKE